MTRPEAPLKTSWFSTEQSIGSLRETEAGVPVPELARNDVITVQARYRLRA